MRRFSGVLILASFGLVGGCGDDGNKITSGASASASTTLPPLTTSDPATGTDSSATTGPTTTDGASGTDSDSDSDTTAPTTSIGETTEGTMTTAGPTTEPVTSTTMMTTVGTTTGPPPCQEIMATVQPVKPNTMLVLDKSGSMLKTWDHDADGNTAEVSRWFSLYAVVNEVLTNFNDSFNFGMNLFPSKSAKGTYDDQACLVNQNVEVAVAPLNKDPILGALPAQSNMTIAGGTPTAIGMTAALNHLKSLDPAIPRIVMLVTDGAANCSTSAANLNQLFEVYDENLAPIVGDAFTVDSIPTYVIGIAIDNANNSNEQDGNPNSINPYEKLNELATLGGTAKPGPESFYSAANQIELAAALEAIVADAQSCIIPLDAPPAFPAKTVVKIGDTPLTKVDDCSMGDGWAYLGPEPYMAIEICGVACDDLKIAGEADVEYFCDAG